MFENKEGQKVPQVTFKTRKENAWVDLTTDELFNGKKVILFSLPGAFTPTCSSKHLPGYVELEETFKGLGIDSILCLSVNDSFVMNEWAKVQKVGTVRVLPDGNGEFSEKMGLLVDKSAVGFGKRSWRYSMLVDDGMIKKMFIEPEKPGDPFEVSDAETMLEYLSPGAKRPPRVTLFGKKGCPHCERAKTLLHKKGVKFEEVLLEGEITQKTLYAVSGRGTTPQIFFDGKHIGGADDLEKHLNS